MFTAYGTTPVYAAFFRELGWAERLDPMVEAWEAGDRKLALERCPEDLVREVFVFGDAGRDEGAPRRVRGRRDHELHAAC